MGQREPFLRNPDGSLRANLTFWQSLQITLLAWVVSAYLWLVRWTCRFDVVAGSGYVETARREGPVIACAWHQAELVSGIYLLNWQRLGMRMGFLISPSREGEFIARVAALHGGAVMRGSSTRSGREALWAMGKALREGKSPVVFADGPSGPAQQFKAGAVILSRRTGAAVLPVGCALNRYWQLRTWDGTLIPKPFARFRIALGPPQIIGRDADAATEAERLGRLLNELTEQAWQGT
ncbi:lysophospholipid acyltransferase family protein [Spectribacter hydrogenoxidans]|uniref:Lysophospholipid acyltransferase family protein n=1 Tax=Spectribacter hydrogenoxidans TaxID=3075608 RepID=A0ABU3C1P0_9GAMM|nr:lysophospholipid acyltransferase family protein [Salinisphaera sp. W335]MDT0635286.1 lysophospholipid acyltransferase family protein [Salinisphaera sp. W335]